MKRSVKSMEKKGKERLVLSDTKELQVSALNSICSDTSLEDNEYYCIEMVKNITYLFSEYPT